MGVTNKPESQRRSFPIIPPFSETALKTGGVNSFLSPDTGNIDFVSRWRTEPFHGRPYVTSLQQKDKEGEKRKDNTTMNNVDSTFGQRNLCQCFDILFIAYSNKLLIKRIQNRNNSRLILYPAHLKILAL